MHVYLPDFAGLTLARCRQQAVLDFGFPLVHALLDAPGAKCSCSSFISETRWLWKGDKRAVRCFLLVMCECVFPTCQARVVRFYVSCLVSSPLLSSPLFPSFPSAGPQPRSSTPSVRCQTSTTPSVPCRTSTTIIHAQCSLPDRPSNLSVPCRQPRPSTPSVPCRTSTAR